MPAFTDRQVEDTVRAALNRRNVKTVGETRLVIFDRSLLEDVHQDPRLSWRVTVGGSDSRQFFVDARTGQIAFRLCPEQSDREPVARVRPRHAGCRERRQCVRRSCYTFSDDVDVADEDSFNGIYNGDKDAVAALDHVKTTYAFFHENVNRHSYDDESSQVEVFLHADSQRRLAQRLSVDRVRHRLGLARYRRA